MTTRRLATIACTAILACPLPGPAAGPGPQGAGAIDPRTDQAIRALGITAWTIQDLSLPAGRPDAFDFDVVLAGLRTTISMNYDSINSEDCELLIQVESGEFVKAELPDPCTFTGLVQLEVGGTVSCQLIDGQVRGIILPEQADGWSIQPLTDAMPNAPKSLHIVYRIDDNVPGAFTCGVGPGDKPPVPHQLMSGGGSPVAGPLRCDVAADADYPFFVANGSDASKTAQDIAGVMANASNYYKKDANVFFKMIKYVIRTAKIKDPYTSSNAGTLLDQLRADWNKKLPNVDRDIVHLFTGRNLDGSTIGLAFLDIICNKTWAYGLSQSRFASQPAKRAALSAHEIGHNFSANHCDVPPKSCDPCRIMLATQGSTTLELTSFGCSGLTIKNYAKAKACLTPTLGGSYCGADLNDDGALDADDFIVFQTWYGAADPRADINADGALDIDDFIVFQTSFAAGCP